MIKFFCFTFFFFEINFFSSMFFFWYEQIEDVTSYFFVASKLINTRHEVHFYYVFPFPLISRGISKKLRKFKRLKKKSHFVIFKSLEQSLFLKLFFWFFIWSFIFIGDKDRSRKIQFLDANFWKVFFILSFSYQYLRNPKN